MDDVSPPPEPGAESDNRRIGRSSAWLMAAQLLGYACRFARAKIIAVFFGTSVILEAYQAAFNVPQTAGSILNAAMLAALLPMLIEARHRGGEREGAALWTRYGVGAAAAVFAVSAVIIALARPLVGVLTSAGTHDQALAAHLLRIQMAYMALYFVQQYLILLFQSHRHFVLPTLLGTPGLIINTAVMWLLLIGPMRASAPETKVEALVWGLYANTVFMIVCLTVIGRRAGFLTLAWDRVPGLGSAAWHSFAQTLSTILSPASLLTVDVILAAPIERGIATVNYSYGIFMAPVAVGVYSLGYVLLPYLSSQIVKGEWGELSRTLSLTFRVLIYVTVPIAAGMWAVSDDFVRLFEGGQFTPEDTALVGATLRVFAWALIPASLLNTLLKAFNAMRRVRAILIVSALAFAAKILAILALRGPLGAPGVAWGSVVYFVLSVAVLGWWMLRVLPIRLDPAIAGSAMVSCLGGVVMVAGVLGVRAILSRAGLGNVPLLATEVAAGAAIWVAWSAALRMPEYAKLRQLVFGRGAGQNSVK